MTEYSKKGRAAVIFYFMFGISHMELDKITGGTELAGSVKLMSDL